MIQDEETRRGLRGQPVGLTALPVTERGRNPTLGLIKEAVYKSWQHRQS